MTPVPVNAAGCRGPSDACIPGLYLSGSDSRLQNTSLKPSRKTDHLSRRITLTSGAQHELWSAIVTLTGAHLYANAIPCLATRAVWIRKRTAPELPICDSWLYYDRFKARVILNVQEQNMRAAGQPDCDYRLRLTRESSRDAEEMRRDSILRYVPWCMSRGLARPARRH